MKRVAKFQEGGTARSGISNDPVGQNFRRLLERMTAPSARSEAPAQGPRPQSGQRPQEDRARMAAEAAAEFDREEAALAERARQRRNRPSAITNQPVGERLAGRAAAPAPMPQASGRSYSIGEGGTLQPESTQRQPAPARPADPRPAQRSRPRMSEADRLNQMELDRIEQDRIDEARRGLREDADRRANQGFFERMGIRRTNETGEGAPSTGSLRGDLQALGRSLGFKKGGAIKGKGMHMMPDGSMMKNKDHAAMKKGGKAMMYREGGKVRQGIQSSKAQEARAEMAEDVMKRSMPAEPRRRMRDMMSPEEGREYHAPLTPQERERIRSSGFKKGGMIKPKTAMKKGGVVKKAAGGKVAAPKKMMMGGMTSKPKKMMGGGRAMYAKGGMAKGKYK